MNDLLNALISIIKFVFVFEITFIAYFLLVRQMRKIGSVNLPEKIYIFAVHFILAAFVTYLGTHVIDFIFYMFEIDGLSLTISLEFVLGLCVKILAEDFLLPVK